MGCSASSASSNKLEDELWQHIMAGEMGQVDALLEEFPEELNINKVTFGARPLSKTLLVGKNTTCDSTGDYAEPPNELTYDHQLPLHWAAWYGQLSTVVHMLEKSKAIVKINGGTSNTEYRGKWTLLPSRRTVLHEAIAGGREFSTRRAFFTAEMEIWGPYDSEERKLGAKTLEENFCSRRFVEMKEMVDEAEKAEEEPPASRSFFAFGENEPTTGEFIERASNLEMVKYLLTQKRRKCMDVNARDHKGRTPLHYAAFFGPPAVVRALLEGAPDLDLTPKDDAGQTPLDYARTPLDHKVVCGDVTNVNTSMTSAPNQLKRNQWLKAEQRRNASEMEGLLQ